MRKLLSTIVVTGLVGVSLAGCGHSPGCRALTGAGIGAAAGGAAGAAAGGLTSPDTVNLGNAPCD